MKRGRWSAADDSLLRELYPCTRTSELPARLGRSMSAIKNRVAGLHLRKDPEASMRRRWVPDEDAVIRMLYADTPTDAMCGRPGTLTCCSYRLCERCVAELRAIAKDAGVVVDEELVSGAIARHEWRRLTRKEQLLDMRRDARSVAARSLN